MKTHHHLCQAVICTALFFLSTLLSYSQLTEKIIGYGDASYTGLSVNEYLTKWLILGPLMIPDASAGISDAMQKDYFNQDPVTLVAVHPKKEIQGLTINNKNYNWKQVTCRDGILDFNKLLGAADYAVAYALAEIKTDEPVSVLISLGSDDAVKVFVNGVEVHKNWIGRSAKPDEDVFSIDLKKGSNQILVKIQNMQGDWSFMMRKPGKDVLGSLLVESAGRGHLDFVKLLINNGAEINAKNQTGLTAYQFASVRGRQKVVDYLKEKGAETEIPYPSLEQLADNMFKNVQNGISPGVSVLVAKNGEILLEKGYGYADVGNRVTVNPETKFRIGSITKQFIAASILKLQEEGKISVQDRLSKFYPDFPRADEVTVHHLLTHTSGIHSYTNRPDVLKYIVFPVTQEAIIDTIIKAPYDFNPGEQYAYNNSGFFLLGCIIEKISGKSLADYLNDSLFEPLGMRNTGIYQTNRLLDNEAYGYTFENGKVSKALNWDMSWAGGAGALYSTVKDLYIWNEAVFNGKVISEESAKAAFASALLNNKELTNYGYGWSLDEYRNMKFIAHGGGLHGFTSYILRQPESRITTVVLCNAIPAPEGVNTGTNAMELAEYLLWNDMSDQKSFDGAVNPDEKVLAQYAGRYDYGQGAVLIVTLDKDQLYAQLTGQPQFPIFPLSEDEFMWKVVEARIKFLRDSTGTVTHAVHHQNNQQLKVKKLNEVNPVPVNTSLYDNYTGKYQLQGNYMVNISKAENKLFIQAINLPKYELLPSSDTEFLTREINVKVKFILNNEGIAEKITFIIGDTGEQTAIRLKDPE